MLICRSILFVLFITIVDGYSSGSPKHICLVPFPHHDTEEYTIIPQANDIIPYNITCEPDTYKENITLNIFIRSRESYKLAGILLSIKPKTNDIANPVGTFIQCNSTDIQYYNFSNEVNSCLTHSSSNQKPSLMHCIYQTPSINYGTLILSSVFVNRKDVFWANVEKEIKYNGNSPQVPLKSPTISLSSNEDISINTCGNSKNCILYPNSCYKYNNCQYMISYKSIDDYIDFELVGPDSGYIAMGISFDTKMKDDLVVVCANNIKSKSLSVQTGYTGEGKTKYLVTTVDYNLIERKAGKRLFLDKYPSLACKFRMLGIQENKILDTIPQNLSVPLYIFFANGDTYYETSYVKKHKVYPMMLDTPVILYSNQTNVLFYFRGMSYNVKVHGTIMTIAFILVQPIGIIIALHFRFNLSNEVCKRQMWFSIHAICNLLYFVLAVSGYFYILVKENFSFKSAKIHGSFGSITIILSFINILMGFLRPDLTSKGRIYFYWAHLINGISIRIFGFLTFWLVYFTLNVRDEFKFWMLIVLILWTAGEMIFGIAFRTLRLKESREYYFNSGDKVNAAFKHHVNNWGLIIYIGFLIGLLIFLISVLWIQ